MSLLDTNLENGRRWVRVGDFFEITKKPRGLDVSALKAIPFIPMELIPQGGGYNPNFIEKSPGSISSGTYFEKGDILVAKITPSFENGKQSLVENLPLGFGYATTEVIPLRPKSNLSEKRLLFFYLLHPDIRSFVAEKMEGATGRQRVPENVLLDLLIPEIEYPDQVLIADTLELVQNAIGCERGNIENCKKLKITVMQKLFTRGLRDEPQTETEIGPIAESWKIEPLGSHYSVVSGGTPSRDVPKYWKNGVIPWVKTTEVNYGTITSTQEYITSEGLKNSAAKKLPPGTLLMAMYGQGVTRGRVAFLGIEAACNQACAALQPKDDKIDSGFLFYFLTYRYQDIRLLAHGGHQQNLNLDIVREIKISYPTDIEEQKDIAKTIDAIDKKIKLHKKKKLVLESLFESLLHKLMLGEIRVSELDLSALKTAKRTGVLV